MNQKPLPKPGTAPSTPPQNKKGGGATPPPSSLKPAPITKPSASKKPADTNTIYSGDKTKGAKPPVAAKSRIPLTQKPPATPKPGTTPPPAKKGDVALPPTSLSALSSMSSNKIPAPGSAPVVTPAPTATTQQTTVLGKPLPQAMRGEAAPKALAGQPAPVPTAPKPVAPSSTDKQVAPAGDKKDPKFAEKKRSPVLRFLPFILGGIVLIAIIGFIASRFLGGSTSTSVTNNVSSSNPDQGTSQQPVSGSKGTVVPSEQTTVNYWGLWEPDEVMQEIITEFESLNPGVKIVYTKQFPRDYRERLQTAIESGSGPDLFRYHASWVPMLKKVIDPIPSAVVSSKEFSENYYPVVSEQLIVAGQHVGVPLMYDGLALFYNEDILDSASETPPDTWADLRTLASKLTINSATGIERAGLAIGNSSNVDHFSDILATLMLQNGADFTNPNSAETRDALLFYTNFLTTDKVWSDTLPNSTVAFARGDVAMIFAPSWRAHEIQALNPELNFKAAPMPQLSDERVTWASYWVEGINSQSKNKEVAGSFLAFLSQEANLKKLYSKASEIRAFGEIYPKVSMASELVDNPIAEPILSDAIDAQSWYLNSNTHDNGINDQMIEYYKTAVGAVLEGDKIDDVLKSLEAGTTQVLRQYSVSSK